MDFVTVAMDQIVNQAGKMHYFLGGQVTVPLIIRTPIVSRIGMGPQHSQSLEAWFMHVPGLKLAIPSNAYDAKGLLKTALRDNNPVVFLENVKLYGTKEEVPRKSISSRSARRVLFGREAMSQWWPSPAPSPRHCWQPRKQKKKASQWK